MTIRKSTAMIAAITMLAVGACAKKAPDTLPPAPEGTGTDTGAGTGTGVVPGSQEDFLAAQDETWRSLTRCRERDECAGKLIELGLLQG